MWDSTITLLIVAAAAVYVARRLFLKPHCGPSDGCNDCARIPESARKGGLRR